jgi:hypothetical protein
MTQQSQPTQPTHPFAQQAECLYVSPTLDAWDMDDYFPGITKIRDLYIQSTWYRQVEPTYYAWLRKRTAQVITNLQKNPKSQKTIEELKERFNAVHRWAMQNIPEHYLKEAVAAMTDEAVRNYELPGTGEGEKADLYQWVISTAPEPFSDQ